MIPAVPAARTAGGRLPALLALALVLTVLAPGVRAAESLYVIEQLVVGVTSAPGGEGDRVATIKSGDRVEVLDRQGQEAQIQLSDGTSGWVKASYLSAEPPLQRRLQDQTAQVEKLKQEVARLQSQARAASVLPARTASSVASAPPAGPPLRSASPAAGSGTAGPAGQSDSQGNPPAAATRDPSPFMGGGGSVAQPSWLWVVAASLVTLVLGFATGWRVLDRRIRRKYGGLRIY